MELDLLDDRQNGEHIGVGFDLTAKLFGTLHICFLETELYDRVCISLLPSRKAFDWSTHVSGLLTSLHISLLCSYVLN